MTNRLKKLLQIVPQAPGNRSGVGDYALILAEKLRDICALDTIFAPAMPARDAAAQAFEILPSLASSLDAAAAGQVHHVILHFVNYGYQKRGVPYGLLTMLRNLRQILSGRFLTVFHELYASGSPWSSAFWLRPFQINIARAIGCISDVLIVSSEPSRRELAELAPDKLIEVHPVISNFGEPDLSIEQLKDRNDHRWVICGGTALVARSLHSFRAMLGRIPSSVFPRELMVIGGDENASARAMIAGLPNIRGEYYPEVDAAWASELLRQCSFAWLDYFVHTSAPTAGILKSTAFAAACAHGVVPILPNSGTAISLGGDRLPGPFCISASDCVLPDDRAGAAVQFFDWYQRHASSHILAKSVADALEVDPNQP